ncbi:MAG: PfkB family carbohydrate kinase [Candidatus Eisenbacteria bacterium]
MGQLPFPPPLPPQRRYDVVGLGANAADHLITMPRHPRPGEKVRFERYVRAGGGQTATALVTVARFGFRTRYFGAVGDDADGHANLDGLRQAGVDVSGVLVRPGGATQRAFILVDRESGERTILWGRSEGLILGADEVDASAIGEGRIFHTDAQDPRAAARAARAARAAGMPVIADLELVREGLDEFLPWIDFLIADAGFPERATGSGRLEESMRILEERTGGAMVIVTLGAQGAVARVAGATMPIPAYAVRAVDSTGAGDVFHGAFAVAALEGMPIGRALDFCAAVAAMKCLREGGRAGIPRTIAEVESFQAHTARRT